MNFPETFQNHSQSILKLFIFFIFSLFFGLHLKILNATLKFISLVSPSSYFPKLKFHTNANFSENLNRKPLDFLISYRLSVCQKYHFFPPPFQQIAAPLCNLESAVNCQPSHRGEALSAEAHP